VYRCLGLILLFAAGLARADDPTRVLPPGRLPPDSRLGKPKDLNGYFPMAVPPTKEAWEARRRELREQVLVATGLWPMPERPPIQAVVHGKIDRGAYTVEKVFFASYPGHYVSGNLYRPKGAGASRPGVLCPHGHWRHGRFTDELVDRGDQGDAYIKDQLRRGAERTPEGARFPLQARCAQLARMGCVVFHYDMVGYADSRPIDHRRGFTDAAAELRLQSFMGLQTFNSVRALDFLAGLPDADPRRVGVTGASGGGTQTFILCAIDDRPAAAFPAVMVSTAMQGGCVCENCSHLRVGAGNIDLAGLFAPKPLGMTGANDWTREIETKGLPELKALYRLYGAEPNVMARCLPQFDHNYNQVSREVMYNWFNRHLGLGQAEPVEEQPFVPVLPKELSVFDDQHPRPADAAGAETLRATMTALADRQTAALRAKHPASLDEFRRVVGTALRVMVHDRLPDPADVDAKPAGATDEVRLRPLLLGRKGAGEQIPAVLLSPRKSADTVVVWVDPAGKASLAPDGKLSPVARTLWERGVAVLAPDVFLTGEFEGAKPPPVDATYAGFTFGYNRTALANRVHDILTAVGCARGLGGVTTVHLVGFEKAGPWVVLARALCGDAVARTAADANGFRFDRIRDTADEMMLPGALKYGGLPAFAALCAPGELLLHNTRDTGVDGVVNEAYRAANAEGRLRLLPDRMVTERLLDWLLR
jgi:dienelactone hydrolase